MSLLVTVVFTATFSEKGSSRVHSLEEIFQLTTEYHHQQHQPRVKQPQLLTQWDQNNDGRHFADIFKAFYWMPLLELQIKFVEICSLRCNWQCVSTSSNNSFAPNRRQDITWNNTNLLHWRIWVDIQSVLGNFTLRSDYWIYIVHEYEELKSPLIYVLTIHAIHS